MTTLVPEDMHISRWAIVSSARWVYLSTSLLKYFTSHKASERSETSAELTHLARETVPYAFSRTIYDVCAPLINVFII